MVTSDRFAYAITFIASFIGICSVTTTIVLILLAMCVIVAVTSVAYIETLWMKNEIKQERKELRKLKKELEDHVQSH